MINDIKKKILIPFVLPMISVVAVATLSIGFSRIFLSAKQSAGEHAHSNSPVVIAGVLIVVIMLLASFVAMSKKMRGNSLLVAFGVICALVMLIGGILYSSGESSEVEVRVGEVLAADQKDDNPLNVEALATNSFQAKEFNVKQGVIQTNLLGKGGSHNLTFKDSRYSWFKPVVNGEQTVTEYINLEPGTYYFYCSVPGHEQAGMFADLIVK